MNKIILFIIFSFFSTQVKAQGGMISIPANVQTEIVEYIYGKNLDNFEKHFFSSKEDGNIFVWEVPLEAGMTNEVCIYSPEKLVRDDSISGRIDLIYKTQKNEISLILWVKDIEGDLFGALLERVPKKQKNRIIKKADLSAFEKKFKKI